VSVYVGAVAGMVLFLEEDHFVAEDFIHVLRLMERTCRTSCDRCNILSLGTYLKTYNYYGESKKVSRSCSIAMFSSAVHTVIF
jgi:alpha-1,6-mannosyl-glycoprotein beta-1,2-N-acetylglucosaminyltransferase